MCIRSFWRTFRNIIFQHIYKTEDEMTARQQSANSIRKEIEKENKAASESVIRIKELLELIRYTAENNAGGLHDQDYMDEVEELGEDAEIDDVRVKLCIF
jgi:hypothetical protein